MVTLLLLKNTFIKIKKSFGRYISLFIIVMVGVGFFAGIQASAPDIDMTLTRYNNSQKFMDFQIISTMGLTNDDVHALQSLNNISTVVPSYSLDALVQGKAIRVHAIEESVNTVKLIDGRMPITDNECVADSRNYKIGDEVNITSDVSEKMKNTTFIVVGTIKSPFYLSYDYGKTTVGDGKLSSFIFINKDNFTLDVYTQIYITAAGTGNVTAFSKEYDNISAQMNDELVKLKPSRENARYEEIYNKANNEINDNEKTLQNEKTKAETELTDAKAQLDANAAKLHNAENELSKNETDLETKTAAQNADFKAAKAQIASGWEQINTTLQKNGISKEELPAKINELNSAMQSMKQQLGILPAGSPNYAQLSAQINQYSVLCEGLRKLQTSILTLTAQEDQLNQGIAAFNSQISNAKNEIAKGKTELAENKKKLDDGYNEYNQNLVSLEDKMAEAEAKIQDAKAKLSDIEKPKWNILKRNMSVAGYGDLKAGAETITSVAKIFPLFFMLIVILMTSNTMARMIAEERGELGTLTSLGFKDRKINLPILFFFLSATV